ncbi:swi5-like zinc finger protein [Coemansia sp. RSA 2611]|nr:swi5-like zinc finger protein [Coemansia sp. RSA 2610]KAJ2389993.1 swi5-like zinc finger protein [Coemansia sp. RSA 2611]
MDASPSKRTPSSDAPSLVAEASSKPLFAASLADERKQELRQAISALQAELSTQLSARDALLNDSGMTVEQARKLNDQNIDRLHRYNDIKDAAQTLFGKLAELKGQTVKEIYGEYGVGLDD